MTVISQLSSHVKGVYKATRFSTAKDTWPPEKLKGFISLALLHHKGEHTMTDITAIAEALQVSGISDVMSATSKKPHIVTHRRVLGHDKLQEALKVSKKYFRSVSPFGMQ